MGLAGVSATQLLIVLLIALAIFGSKHLKTLGSDLGTALKGFRNAMNARDEPEKPLLRIEDGAGGGAASRETSLKASSAADPRPSTNDDGD